MAGARVDADGAWIRGPRSAPPTSRKPHDCEPAGSIAASAQLRPCVPALSARSSTMLAPSGNLTSVPDGRCAARQVQLAGQHQRGRLAVVRQRARQRHAGGPAQRRQRRRRREHAARAQARVGRQRDALRQQRAGRIQQRAVGIVHGGCQDGASGQRQRLRQGARHRQHGARREPRLRQGSSKLSKAPTGKSCLAPATRRYRAPPGRRDMAARRTTAASPSRRA